MVCSAELGCASSVAKPADGAPAHGAAREAAGELGIPGQAVLAVTQGCLLAPVPCKGFLVHCTGFHFLFHPNYLTAAELSVSSRFSLQYSSWAHVCSLEVKESSTSAQLHLP